MFSMSRMAQELPCVKLIQYRTEKSPPSVFWLVPSAKEEYDRNNKILKNSTGKRGKGEGLPGLVKGEPMLGVLIVVR